MKIIIEKATASDLNQMEAFYEAVVEKVQEGENFCGWRKGFYPTKQTAEDAFHRGSLYVVKEKGNIIASMSVNHDSPEAYRDVEFGKAISPEKVLLIHTLSVHPDYAGQGMAGAMLRKVCEDGKKQGIEAVRLDTYEKNQTGKHLYEREGFAFCGIVDLGLTEEAGLQWFHVYEKLL